MGVALVLGGWLAASAVVSVAVGAVVARADADRARQPLLPAEPAAHQPAVLHLVSSS